MQVRSYEIGTKIGKDSSLEDDVRLLVLVVAQPHQHNVPRVDPHLQHSTAQHSTAYSTAEFSVRGGNRTHGTGRVLAHRAGGGGGCGMRVRTVPVRALVRPLPSEQRFPSSGAPSALSPCTCTAALAARSACRMRDPPAPALPPSPPAHSPSKPPAHSRLPPRPQKARSTHLLPHLAADVAQPLDAVHAVCL